MLNIIVTLKSNLRSLKLVSFKGLGVVSYSPSIVTMVVSVAVCEIFRVEEWCYLENRVRVRSRSLKMAPFDRSHTSSYSPYYGAILYRLRDIVIVIIQSLCCHLHKTGGPVQCQK